MADDATQPIDTTTLTPYGRAAIPKRPLASGRRVLPRNRQQPTLLAPATQRGDDDDTPKVADTSTDEVGRPTLRLANTSPPSAATGATGTQEEETELIAMPRSASKAPPPPAGADAKRRVPSGRIVKRHRGNIPVAPIVAPEDAIAVVLADASHDKDLTLNVVPAAASLPQRDGGQQTSTASEGSAPIFASSGSSRRSGVPASHNEHPKENDRADDLVVVQPSRTAKESPPHGNSDADLAPTLCVYEQTLDVRPPSQAEADPKHQPQPGKATTEAKPATESASPPTNDAPYLTASDVQKAKRSTAAKDVATRRTSTGTSSPRPSGKPPAATGPIIVAEPRPSQRQGQAADDHLFKTPDRIVRRPGSKERSPPAHTTVANGRGSTSTHDTERSSGAGPSLLAAGPDSTRSSSKGPKGSSISRLSKNEASTNDVGKNQPPPSVPTRSTTTPSRRRTATAGSPTLAPGDAVEVLWGGHWHQAWVAEMAQDGLTVDVEWLDGKRETTKRSNVRVSRNRNHQGNRNRPSTTATNTNSNPTTTTTPSSPGVGDCRTGVGAKRSLRPSLRDETEEEDLLPQSRRAPRPETAGEPAPAIRTPAQLVQQQLDMSSDDEDDDGAPLPRPPPTHRLTDVSPRPLAIAARGQDDTENGSELAPTARTGVATSTGDSPSMSDGGGRPTILLPPSHRPAMLRGAFASRNGTTPPIASPQLTSRVQNTLAGAGFLVPNRLLEQSPPDLMAAVDAVVQHGGRLLTDLAELERWINRIVPMPLFIPLPTIEVAARLSTVADDAAIASKEAGLLWMGASPVVAAAVAAGLPFIPVSQLVPSKGQRDSSAEEGSPGMSRPPTYPSIDDIGRAAVHLFTRPRGPPGIAISPQDRPFVGRRVAVGRAQLSTPHPWEEALRLAGAQIDVLPANGQLELHQLPDAATLIEDGFDKIHLEPWLKHRPPLNGPLLLRLLAGAVPWPVPGQPHDISPSTLMDDALRSRTLVVAGPSIPTTTTNHHTTALPPVVGDTPTNTTSTTAAPVIAIDPGKRPEIHGLQAPIARPPSPPRVLYPAAEDYYVQGQDVTGDGAEGDIVPVRLERDVVQGQTDAVVRQYVMVGRRLVGQDGRALCHVQLAPEVVIVPTSHLLPALPLFVVRPHQLDHVYVLSGPEPETAGYDAVPQGWATPTRRARRIGADDAITSGTAEDSRDTRGFGTSPRYPGFRWLHPLAAEPGAVAGKIEFRGALVLGVEVGAGTIVRVELPTGEQVGEIRTMWQAGQQDFVSIDVCHGEGTEWHPTGDVRVIDPRAICDVMQPQHQPM